MHDNGFNIIFTNHDWYKLVKTNIYFILQWQNIGNINNALVTIGKSSVVENYDLPKCLNASVKD